MSHISYKSLKKYRIETLEDKKVLGRLLSFAFNETTGQINSVMYSSEEKGKKHVLKGVGIVSLNDPIQVDFAEPEEERPKLWIPNDQKVFTVTGIYLGKVKDVLIDDEIMKLSFVDVTQQFLLVSIKSYLVSRDAIVSLHPSKIIVKDSVVLEKVAESYTQAASSVPLMENSSQSVQYDK